MDGTGPYSGEKAIKNFAEKSTLAAGCFSTYGSYIKSMKGEISTTQKIHLRGYTAQPSQPGRKLWLGTCGSYGTEQLELCPGPGWAGLTLSATFHPPGCQPPVRVLADKNRRVTVPPEATASASLTQPGRIVFTGLAEGVQRISCNLLYYVADHANAEGPESSATPSVLEQALAQMGEALRAAQAAVALTQEVALNTPQISINDTWLVWDDEADAYRDTGVYAGGKAPTIGENKNWFVAGVDTGICAEGRTPVLGEDYLTEEDLRQLTEQVVQDATAQAQKAILNMPKLSDRDTWLIWDPQSSAYRDTEVCAAGQVPFIGENKHWFVGEVDTGISAEGKTPVLGVDYLTEEEIHQLTENITQAVLSTVDQTLTAHNAAPDAHPDLWGALQSLAKRVQVLEINGPAPTENAFQRLFNTLSGLTVSGVWNQKEARLEF